MCRVGAYFAAFAAGILFALTMNVLALPRLTGLVVQARPVQERGAVSQTVDRRHKTDRLSVPNKTTRDIVPYHPAPVPSGAVLVVAICSSGHCQYRSG
jgi:hypothetical protein